MAIGYRSFELYILDVKWYQVVIGRPRPSIKVAQNGFVVVESRRLWLNPTDTFVFPGQCDQVFYHPMHGDENGCMSLMLHLVLHQLLIMQIRWQQWMREKEVWQSMKVKIMNRTWWYQKKTIMIWVQQRVICHQTVDLHNLIVYRKTFMLQILMRKPHPKAQLDKLYRFV